MNHCVEVICISCGYQYCAVGGCNGQMLPVEAVKIAIETIINFHYKNLRCRNCFENTVYEYDTIIKNQIFKSKTASVGNGH